MFAGESKEPDAPEAVYMEVTSDTEEHTCLHTHTGNLKYAYDKYTRHSHTVCLINYLHIQHNLIVYSNSVF